MLFLIFGGYLSLLIGAYVATVVLILTGRSWGRLPWLYLKAVEKLQSFFPSSYPTSEGAARQSQWPQLIDKPSFARLSRPDPDGAALYNLLRPRKQVQGRSVEERTIQATIDLAAAGLTAIVQDDFSAAFTPAPSFVESLNGYRIHVGWSTLQKALFAAGLGFRMAFLVPVRVALMLTSFAWLFYWAVHATVKKLGSRKRAWVAMCYSRLFCAGIGVIAVYEDTKNRPHGSGFAVSSHLTPNDAQILSADMPVDQEQTYTVTGQRHTGLIGTMEVMAARVISTLWLDRANAKERKDFARQVLEAATEDAPVLFFPEGYCSNNTQVLQFRRAIFVHDVDIHPIAIRQDARFGDGFWWEDLFKDYMLRLLTSWAVVYRVTYLPSTRRTPEETASQFAARVHASIAAASDTTPAIFDGSFWYKKSEQERILEHQRIALAEILVPPRKPSMELVAPPKMGNRTLSEELRISSALPSMCNLKSAAAEEKLIDNAIEILIMNQS